MPNLTAVNPKENIIIKGAKLHNLKNIDVVIPRNKLVVITGLSGSGKSSLAFDTLYAEGQRRYVESLSSYARQFLGKLDKPKVDYIKGIAPAIAIEQKVNSTNPRSTVGTTTEIYDYIKLLYARIGKTFSPISGKQVKKDTVTDVIEYVKTFDENTKLLLLAPITIREDRDTKKSLELFSKQGYARIKYDEKVIRIDQAPETIGKEFCLVIDRIITKVDDDFYNRLANAVDTAFFEGKGRCIIERLNDTQKTYFSNTFELDDMLFLEPNVHLFSFNNPYGACPKCEGYGDVIGIDEDLVIPNTALSIYENAVFPWRGDSMGWYRDQLVNSAYKFDFPIHKPWFELTEAQQKLVWDGNAHFIGLHKFFAALEEKSYKIQNRVMLSRYRGKTRCNVCGGKRLRSETDYVKIGKKSISELVGLPIERLITFFNELKLLEHDTKISNRLLKEINTRLGFLDKVGLNYLTLNRKSNTLSGGESQRINLATSLGSSLVGSMYILDEPSIGLHPRDTKKLIDVLKHLQKIGNSVIVVEHDEDIIRSADQIIDLGPDAGRLGGEVVFQGTQDEIKECRESYTGQYLSDVEFISVPAQRRKWNNYIEITGARENNLKGIDVKFPLNIMTLITGVSGSGKSSLIKNILFPLLSRYYKSTGQRPGKYDDLRGDLDLLHSVEYVDQNPIGKSSRSNPVTYIKAYDEIRKLFASCQAAKINNLKPSHFSFNTAGGRCEECQGEGTIKVEMQFMPDVTLKCEVCNGKRFKDEVLEVKYSGKSIYDVLEMTINEAIEFFESDNDSFNKKIVKKLKVLQSVGLGYLKLGQPSSTLSGGESQRIKLAYFISLDNKNANTIFLFDEPSTGLHYHDISNLLKAFNELIRKGHTVIIIEHNMEIIKCADWVIDLGKEGGENGGTIIAEGTPETVSMKSDSYTGRFLKEKLPEKIT